MSDENINETAAAESIKTTTGNISDIVKKMEGASKDDWTKLAEVLDQIGSEANNISGTAEANRKSISAKTMKEDLALVFGKADKDISEDFLNDLHTLFEAAVAVKVATEKEAIMFEAAEVLEEELDAQHEELVEQMNTYLEYSINEWAEQNAVALESQIAVERAESLMEGLAELFEAHNLEVSDETVDVVEALEAEIDELRESYNEVVNENLEILAVFEEAERENIVEHFSEGLAATDRERFETIVEGISAGNVDEFASKVKLIREKYDGVEQDDYITEDSGTAIVPLNENINNVESDRIALYSATISKLNKNK